MKQPNRAIRRILLLLSFGCLLWLLPAGVAAAETDDQILVSLVYGAPNATGRVAGRMEEGTKVCPQRKIGDYYEIDCYDTVGYIAASQLAQAPDGGFYISCDPQSQHTTTMDTWDVADALTMRGAILELAKAQLGDPYVYGATGPNAFDCSGFTSFLYKNNGYSLARICSGQMAQGIIISREGLQVGDLILFGASYYDVRHIAIYAGDGQIIHAGSGGIGYARLDGAWFAQNYLCARRIITVGNRLNLPANSLLTWSGSATIRGGVNFAG